MTDTPIQNFLYNKNDKTKLNAEEIAVYLNTGGRRAPNNVQDHRSRKRHEPFALTFTPDMLSREELANAENIQSQQFGSLCREIQSVYRHVVLVTSTSMIDDAVNSCAAWGNCLPLGGDGIWSVTDSRHQSMLCSVGSRSNSWHQATKEHRQEFRAFGFGWHAGERAVVPVALFAAVRHYMLTVLNVKFTVVKVWNSDDHLAYAALRKVFFERDGVAFTPCPVHIVLRAVEMQIGGREHVEELVEQLTIMKHAGSQSLFEHVRLASIDLWVRKNNEDCIKYLEHLAEKPFHVTQSGLPGHVSDNQPIESLQKIVREFVGRKVYTPEKFFRDVLWDLVAHMSARLNCDNEPRGIHTVTSALCIDSVGQLKALQSAYDGHENWRRVAYRVAYRATDGVAGAEAESYVMPAIRVAVHKSKESNKRGYELKVQLVEADAARAYVDALRGIGKRAPYSSTRHLHETVGNYNLITRVGAADVQGLPEETKSHMLRIGWKCNCLDYGRRVVCGHVYFGLYINDPASPAYRWNTLLTVPFVSKNKSVRAKFTPGTRKRKMDTVDGIELQHYNNVTAIGKKPRRNSANDSAPIPAAEPDPRSPLSPKYVNNTIPISRRMSVGDAKRSSHRELRTIVKSLSNKNEETMVRWHSWRRKLKMQSGDDAGVDSFCDTVDRDVALDQRAHEFHPWYLSYFFDAGDQKLLPDVVTMPSNASVMDDAPKTPIDEKAPAFLAWTRSEAADFTVAQMYNMGQPDTRMICAAMNVLCDSLQWHLREQMKKRVAIVSTTLHQSTLLSPQRECTDEVLREGLAWTSKGRDAKWYENDDIYFVFQNANQNHWFAIHYSFRRNTWVSRLYDSLQRLTQQTYRTRSQKAVRDESTCEYMRKLDTLLEFALRKWTACFPDDIDAAKKYEAMQKTKVRFDSSSWPPK